MLKQILDEFAVITHFQVVQSAETHNKARNSFSALLASILKWDMQEHLGKKKIYHARAGIPISRQVVVFLEPAQECKACLRIYKDAIERDEESSDSQAGLHAPGVYPKSAKHTGNYLRICRKQC